MILDEQALEPTLSQKRLGVFFFNKDSRNLLHAHQAGLRAFPHSIEYLFDPTLEYRPRIRELAEGSRGGARLVTSVEEIASLVDEGAFDAVLIFETGYEGQPQDHLVAFEEEAAVDSLEDLDVKCRADYDNYRNVDPNAEFNVRWSSACVQFLAEYLSTRGILVLNAYNALVRSEQANDDLVVAFGERHAILPTLPEWLGRVPIRFILGEDWACGKTSYLIERMKEGASGLAGDFWFRLVSPGAIPSFQMQDIFGIKGVIANLVRRAHERSPGKPVFIKYDGRLEEFVFGFPRDRTYLIKDMHHYFQDCRFAIVQKAKKSERMDDLVARFQKKYEVGPDRIDRIYARADGRAVP